MSVPFFSKPVPSRSKQPATIKYQLSLLSTQPATRRRLKFTFRLICTGLLFAVLLKSLSWTTFLQKLHDLDTSKLLIGMIVGSFGVIISSYQWQSLLIAEHILIDLKRLVNLYLVGIAFSHFLPSGMGGDVVKAYYVGKEGANTLGAASAVVMSRITGFFGMLLVALPAWVIWHGAFSQSLSVAFLLSSFALLSAIVGSALLVIFLPKYCPGTLVNWRILAPVMRIGNALITSAKRPRSMCVAILFGMAFHLIACLNYYSYALVLHVNVPLNFYLVAIPFVSIIAFLPISINGFGLREGAFVYMFTTLHVPIATSLLLTFLIDLQTLILGIVGGCIYLTMNRKRETVETPQNHIQSDPQGRNALPGAA